MKKFILPLSLLLCLTLSLTLIGCADKGNKTNNTKTSYNIQVSQDSEIYTVTDLPATAYEGDTVTFKVNLTHPTDSVLNSVTLSGNTTKETKLSPNSENVYSFTMPGEPVRIKIDTYPGKRFKGHVESIQRATGAKSSLFPPENAVGSYVKIVQRVPVKIVFDEDISNYNIVPGMSVVPKVKIK